MNRRFLDASPEQRCAWTVSSRDGSDVQCCRRKAVGGLCTQHAKMVVRTRQCEVCDKPFVPRTGAIDLGMGKFCSYACARRKRTMATLEHRYPDVMDMVRLMFPFMATKDLSAFIGQSTTIIRKAARRAGLRKDHEYLVANKRSSHHWPADESLREIRRLQIGINRLANRRAREAS